MKTKVMFAMLTSVILVAGAFAQDHQAPSSTKRQNAQVSASADSQEPQETTPAGKEDEIIAYRFRLGQAVEAYNLVVINSTDRPGRLFFRGLTPELESQPTNIQPLAVGPGERLTLSAGDLKWAKFTPVYVEASRRLQVQLHMTGQDESLPIPIKSYVTVYDIASGDRLGEVAFADSDRRVLLLGDKAASAIELRAHDDLHIAAAKVQGNGAAVTPEQLFLLLPMH